MTEKLELEAVKNLTDKIERSIQIWKRISDQSGT